jgi:lipopolysaccharide/colanic/teichoic acid biosynthesis glycosyltransferase
MGSRLFDLIFAAVGLAVASPVLLIAMAGIWLADGSPVVHRATRVGLGGKLFTMYKFRTMYVGAHRASRITAPADARCFPFGSMLRRLKIDELPQLVNILKGDMAVVGPRPEDPKMVAEHYTESQRQTLNVTPGLLSPGSIFDYTHGDAFLRSDSTEEDYVRKLLPIILALDAVYLRKASLGYNIRLLARTAWAIAGKAFGRERFPDPPEMNEALGRL